MGLRQTIYVKSPEEWEEIKAAALEEDRSVSWYLIDCHRKVKAGMKPLVITPPKKPVRSRKKSKPDSQTAGYVEAVKNPTGPPAQVDASKATTSETFNPQPKNKDK